MTKKYLAIGAVSTALVLLLTALAWFVTPMGLSKMGVGYNNAWNSFSWSWNVLSILTRLALWSLPLLAVAWLVEIFFTPAASQELTQPNQGGES